MVRLVTVLPHGVPSECVGDQSAHAARGKVRCNAEHVCGGWAKGAPNPSVASWSLGHKEVARADTRGARVRAVSK